MTAGGRTSATSQEVLGLHLHLEQYQCDIVVNYAQLLWMFKSVAKKMCTKSCRYHLFINDIIEVSVLHI